MRPALGSCGGARLLRALPTAPVASVEEVMMRIERRSLLGRGIGWVDA
jgi:hypothetical protein